MPEIYYGEQLLEHLISLKDDKRAQHSQRFFKTGNGEYGEGDVFLGIRVPELRKLAKNHRELDIQQLQVVLTSKYHEARLFGVFCLVYQYQHADEKIKEIIFQWYVNNTQYINNWDIIDGSADKIVGHHLFRRDKQLLYKFANSDDLWRKRIAIMATFYFIKQNYFDDTISLAEILLTDKHDLIQKAIGWMLREIGNRNQSKEETFLKQHYQQMPRTMLRYAIEKFEEPLRQKYLKGKV